MNYGANVKKSKAWGPALAALTLAVLAVIVATTLFLGLRGLL